MPFNLHVCLVTEKWKEWITGKEGVGIFWKYKMNEKLFRRNASMSHLSECQFADDTTSLATSHEGAEVTLRHL